MDTIHDPVIQSLAPEWHRSYTANIDMLRLDMVHPVVSGNKWYKLKHNIHYALEHRYASILTFGGGYSNHLIATAAAAKNYGIRSIGIVRGTYPELTATLKDCTAYGMQLVFVDREEYAQKTDAEYITALSEKYGHPFIIPEGGANEWGREGAQEIASYIPASYTHICVSAGTGTTLIGLRNALPEAQQVWGYVPMKHGDYLLDDIQSHVYKKENLYLFDDWHFGGFGKWNDALISFMNGFYTVNNIPLDIIYTSKMMYGVQEQLQANTFPPDASILCIHTGGLQGNASVSPLLASAQGGGE